MELEFIRDSLNEALREIGGGRARIVRERFVFETEQSTEESVVESLERSDHVIFEWQGLRGQVFPHDGNFKISICADWGETSDQIVESREGIASAAKRLLESYLRDNLKKKGE